MKGVGKPDAGGRLPFARRRRIDGRHQNELPVRLVFHPLPNGRRKLRLIFPVKLQLILRNAEVFRDFPYRLYHGLLGNLHIALHKNPHFLHN